MSDAERLPVIRVVGWEIASRESAGAMLRVRQWLTSWDYDPFAFKGSRPGRVTDVVPMSGIDHVGLTTYETKPGVAVHTIWGAEIVIAAFQTMTYSVSDTFTATLRIGWNDTEAEIERFTEAWSQWKRWAARAGLS